MDPTTVVKAFFDAVTESEAGPAAAFRAWLDPACVWENASVPPCRGLEECLDLLQKSQAQLGFYTWQVEYRGIAAEGDLVLTERLDLLVDRAGERVVDIPVMGALRVSGNRIVEWRDYFDPASSAPPSATGSDGLP